ncbi:MAG: hypothetical protein A3G32_05305 [Deltaproteobacteria bacterium RIFCSPLOWO2_12_FULL_40_28]|nr:MAG: hypothetical protein A3C45_09415 [Deltaproteobacteria bacterium RIFCSPHIGHO2_02_FULL_40_28]OGQ19778.1 MAG: hypothetical protein A3E27_08610 [Deltaproteobacteria bacterium RIFCSPHIGHO2_12_FULL_40_32]OGQ41055.1 MAG: hypothetical protein A3I69_04025 [Deltaproteobacteria bacterium RIFCSPLOWO2_02_FULL_40_36]OGQ54171.1 MAG: hypothetical protein A3G32_05305 [Deltaproteobacteria bacterium RIFCSPLOWO2_12_FULL_40_28]
MFNRIINPSKNNSFFIFGARGTGKSTWLKNHFQNIPHHWIDLLNPDLEELFSKDPNLLLKQIETLPSSTQWIIIDEIQKCPKLLDLVHLAIETHKKKFALTGSSARKLKRGSANLLAGRAFLYHLFPLTFSENNNQTEDGVINWGSLPKIFEFSDDADKSRFLKSYAQTYLKEEIVVEQIVRKLNPFRSFLEISAQQNGEILNYSNIARDVGVDTVTIQSYFQILEDTLVGFYLYPYAKSVRKRQRENPKFYYFDLGVKRALDGTLSSALVKNTYAYGKAFEHMVICEIFRMNSYLEKDYRLSYLRTKDGAEVDLILELPRNKTILIEIKSAIQIDERDLRHVKAFRADIPRSKAYCLSLDPIPKVIDDILCLPWKNGLKELSLHPLS